MKSLQDALYNWLTIKAVVDARPEDTAARETEELFAEILDEQHGVSGIVISKDENMYHVSFDQKGESKTSRFPTDLIEVLLNQINEEPEKYENYPEE
ncbi:hypothetical protein RCG23_05025 [Neobacillus sp. PS3-34]|uniref:hypothetical protein n=1 Tax=Neobacillus sp. PS3-34 TaxID=3070678 RepID=UPI0027E0235A|nr:hypothetical protein [Neobacillus sp. PS3-34]WML49391.1 hypothetical protein RCG23_05025 [Neobacillus sp. PS3-34]